MAEYITSNIKYVVKAVLETEEVVDVTDLCLGLSWGDQKNDMASKADIKLGNTKTDKGYMSDLIKLNMQFYIFANDEEVFRGTVWDWNYTSALKKELDITLYDNMIYLTQSKGDMYFSSGMSTQVIIESLCKDWEIPVSYQGEGWTHGKTVAKNKTIGEHITSVLDEAQTKTGSKYTMLMNKGTLEIKPKGKNTDIYCFDTKNVVSVRDSRSLQNIVTSVIVVGKSEENTRPPLLETVENDTTKYGLLREIVIKDSNKTLDDAKKEAENMLKERGTPKETISVTSVDVPVMRKGDKVKVVAGNISGYFFVESVTHNMDRTMDMELMRCE